MDNDEEESYYEEVIVDDDGEEYIEEILEDCIPLQQASPDNLRATKEQVDNMDIRSAKQYLMALPSAKGPTIPPVLYSDDDYEYEEIEIEEEFVVTPIPKSRRFSHFESRVLDAIVEESDHTVGSPKPTPALRKTSLEKSAGQNEETKSQRVPLPVLEEITLKDIHPRDENDHKVQKYFPEETNGIGESQVNSNKDQVEVSQRSAVATSHTSLLSCSTDTTVPDSERSLEIEEIFSLSTPLASPDQLVDPSSTFTPSPRRSSRHENGESPSHRNREILGTHVTEDSRNSRTRIRHSSSDDRSLGSTRTSESRRRRDSGSSRSARSSKIGEERGKSMEAELQEFLSSSVREERRSLDTMLSSPRSDDRRDADDRSRVSQRSKSQDRGNHSSQYGERERRASKRPSTVMASESSSPEVPKKGSTSKPKGSDTLDAFLSRIPDGPIKRSDARSTVSGSLRSSRRRQGDDRDSQSLAPNASSRRPIRARSARRTKSSQNDLIPTSREPPLRSRSSSVGRKERLRRSRQKLMLEETGRKEIERKPPTSSRSSRDSSTLNGMTQSIDKGLSRRTSSPSPRKSTSGRSTSGRSASPSSKIHSSRRSPSPSSLESLRKAGSPSPRKSSSMRSASPRPRRGSLSDPPPSQRDVPTSPRKNSSQSQFSTDIASQDSKSKQSSKAGHRSVGGSRGDNDFSAKEHKSHSSQEITRVSVQRSRSGRSRHDADRTSFLGRSSSECVKDVSSAKNSTGTPPVRSSRESSNVSRENRTAETFKLCSPKSQERDKHTSFNRTLDLARSLREDSTDNDELDPKLLSPRRDPVGRSASGTKSGIDSIKKIPNVEDSTSPSLRNGERRGSVHRSRSGSFGSADNGDPTSTKSRRGRRVPDRSESSQTHHSMNGTSKRSSPESISASPAGSRSNQLKPPIPTLRTPDPSHPRQSSPLKNIAPLPFHHSLPEMDLPPSMVSLAGHSSDVESYLSTMSSVSTGNVTNESNSGHLHVSSRRGHHSSIPSLSQTPSSMDSHSTMATPFERLRQLEKIKAFLTEEEYQQKKKEILASI